jgi:TolA-binding protein
MRSAIVAAVVVATARAAIAAPPAIELSKRQIAAAARAAKKLEKVDRTKAKQCASMMPSTDEDPDVPAWRMDVAGCFVEAGGSGMAIVYWKRLLAEYPTAWQAEDALRQLGRTYEAIGSYPEAAGAYLRFGRTYPKVGDARDAMVRGICMSEQLGRDGDAAKGVADLARLWPSATFDADHLCDTIRPIQPPAP